MAEPLVIDGAHGEGGGEILRSALALAAVTGRAIVIENVRARRPRPGLAAQHLAALRAVGTLCGASLEGDSLDSTRVAFTPRRPVEAGRYRFDVGAVRKGGSAGSAILVAQALLPALALARGRSEVSVVGGTHLLSSPTFDYARDVWLPALAAMGLDGELELVRWGWYPAGQGEITMRIEGPSGGRFGAFERVHRGALRRVWGRAVVARLPSHIPERMAKRVADALAEAGIATDIAVETRDAVCPGAGVFLAAEYGAGRAGFGALGKRGVPAEEVAEQAVAALLAFERCDAACDMHLGDQLLVPAALADGPSQYSVEAVTDHLTTAAWLVGRFGVAEVDIERRASGTGLVTVTPGDFPVPRR